MVSAMAVVLLGLVVAILLVAEDMDLVVAEAKAVVAATGV
jgi:hypothetical protein